MRKMSIFDIEKYCVYNDIYDIIIVWKYLGRKINMEKKTHIAALFLLSIPVLVAISGLLIKFNKLDLTYLVLVSIIFTRYYFIKKHN